MRRLRGSSSELERYLLGRVSPRERTAIEKRLFADDALAAALEDAEDELIDSYLAGDLAPEDLQDFEEHFAASPLRQERIALRRVLASAVAGHAPRTRTAAADVRAPSPSTRSSAVSTAWRALSPWAGLAAALLIGLWVFQRRPDGGTPGPTAPPSAAAGSPSIRTSPASASPADLVLSAGLLRGGGAMPRLVVPASPETTIDAVLAGDSPATEYAAVLRTVEGRTAWRGSGSVAGKGRIRIVIPSSALSPGDYILAFRPAGRPGAEASEYAFTVARPRR